MFFLELSCFFNDPADVCNSISGSSAFYKNSLNICNFIVHILLKPGLENFEHFLLAYAVVAAAAKLLQSYLTLCDPIDGSPPFLMMYSAYKLNKQGDNIQPRCTPFPIWNQSVCWAPESLLMVTAAMKLKDIYSLEGKL